MSRLDRAVAERGLARSRSAAVELIQAGRVRVNDEVILRSARVVSPADAISVEADPYVSRAAHKLAGALTDLASMSPAVALWTPVLRPAGSLRCCCAPVAVR